MSTSPSPPPPEIREPDERVRALRGVEPFAELEDEAVERLARALVEERFEAGSNVVREGDEGDRLFVVAQGEFQVYLRQESIGFEKELERLGPGGYFGEIALLTGRRRMASVRALTAGRAFALSRRDFEDALGRSPGLALSLCRGLASYLDRTLRLEAAVPLVNMDDIDYRPEVAGLLPANIAALCKAIPIRWERDRVTVAMVDPYDRRAASFLADVLRKFQIEFVAVTEEAFERFCRRHLGRAGERPLATADLGTLTYLAPGGVEESVGGQPAADLVETALKRAIDVLASDIHIEPWGAEAKIRIRIDGRMMDSDLAVPRPLLAHVVSRLKVMGGLDITMRRVPREGSFAVRYADRMVEFRLSVMPCEGGEKAVLRILDPKQLRRDLPSLIFSRPVLLLIRELFENPSGLVLVTGPTGAGKTTTLYAGLAEIWNRSQAVNIVTIEDPVEYRLDWATQIQVNRPVGLDFAQILRSVLRQDPDVMLVGEIRDEESAVVAVEAATTGQLVLSSLHTHFALETIARLKHLGAKPYLLASALKGILSQRLVPRVCVACRQPVEPGDEALLRLDALGILPPGGVATLYRGRGCDVCRSQGELGRVALLEVLAIDDALRDLIERGATIREMEDALRPEQFVPMARYARFLLEEGMVSPAAVARAFPPRVMHRAPEG
ncbi:MAG: Flp pilus assembly complex ATPase component TadA [Planctomycetes bacterium]|nr:Flp pilus assembly complex ATPase component TadA [Planctomycetota bacterium]